MKNGFLVTTKDNAPEFSAVLAEHRSGMRLFLASYAASRAMLEDAEQEVWSAWQRQPANASATGIRIALRRLAAGIIARRLDASQADAVTRQDGALHILAQAGRESLQRQPELTEGIDHRLTTRMAALTQDQRDLLERRYRQGQSREQIAAAHQLSIGQVSAKVIAARAALDWSGLSAPWTVGCDSVLHSLIEDHLIGALDAESRHLLAASLMADVQNAGCFERQVRIDLMLTAWMAPVTSAPVVSPLSDGASTRAVATASSGKIRTATAQRAGPARRPVTGSNVMPWILGGCAMAVIAIIAVIVTGDRPVSPRNAPLSTTGTTSDRPDQPKPAPATTSPATAPTLSSLTLSDQSRLRNASGDGAGAQKPEQIVSASATRPVTMEQIVAVQQATNLAQLDSQPTPTQAIVNATAPVPVPTVVAPKGDAPSALSQPTVSSPVVDVAETKPIFVKGINLGGGAVVIDGNQWLSQKQAEEDLLSPTAPTSPASVIYLSDLTWITASNGWGPVEKDMANGEDKANDGSPLSIRGKTFKKGLGVHANSEVVFALDGSDVRLLAEVGIDDEKLSGGQSMFQVFADGVKLFDSGMLTSTTPSVLVNVGLSGKNELKLITDAGGKNQGSHGDWADARLMRSSALSGSASELRTAFRGPLTIRNAKRSLVAKAAKPTVDAATKSMLDAGISAVGDRLAMTQALPNGSYQVWAWMMEQNRANSRSFDLVMNGETLANLGDLPLGGWAKYGPCTVEVSNGVLDISSKAHKGVPILMGLEIYRMGAAKTPTAQPVYVSDFAKGNTTGWAGWSGEWVSSDGLYANKATQGIALCVYDSKLFGDVELTANVHPRFNNAYGVALEVKSAKDYVALSIQDTTATLFRMSNGTKTQLAQAPCTGTALFAWSTISVTRRGRMLSATINDASVFNGIDIGNAEPNKIGLYADFCPLDVSTVTMAIPGLRLTAGSRVLGLVPVALDITRELGPRMNVRATLRLRDLPKEGINLRVDCDPEVKSAHLALLGIKQQVESVLLESVLPFHVFGDSANRSIKPWIPEVGTYHIEVQPCSDPVGKIPLGPKESFELTIVP